ncbi:MAG: hypothetical protein GX757_05310 [Clostridiales bacterium]|nr:hypothetical protein [Clostridiales bacterium]
MRDNKETFISYLNKSDVSSTKTKIVAEIDGDIISDIYLSNNTLHLIAAKYKFVDGLSTSIERWDLYQINMKNYSVKRITLNDKEGIDTYLPYGVINNKMIIYHRYYTNIINPNDYGIESNVEDYIDTENFNEFMSALSEAYRMDMIALDLASGEITYLDLPIPLLVYGNCYYYNKKTTEGSYELVSFDFITKEEKVICDLPVNYIYALNDRLYITEGNVMKSKYSDNTSVGYKENAKEFIYDLTTHELRELKATLPEKTEIKLLAEVGDYYIILHNDVRGKVTQRIGYILKEDYYNDKSKYTLVPPI